MPTLYEDQAFPGTRLRSLEQRLNLEAVAISLEEGENVESDEDGSRQFDMYRFVHFCGAPACALGYAASRPDLQKVLRIKGRRTSKPGEYGAFMKEASLVYTPKYTKLNGGEEYACYTDGVMQEAFGLNTSQASDLFSGGGCGGATTPKRAAKYIRRFIKNNPKY